MRSLVIGTAGHIDHGKSALVKALTGTDPDRLKEEQERGITIDLGFAHAVIDDVQVAFVDVPGHERFVRNMLAGAGGIDAVLLVVAANELVMPQTREHFDICRLLGIDRGVIVLTKADLVDADTLELAALEVRDLVDGSFLAGAPVVPVSARSGRGLDELRAVIHALADHPPLRGRQGLVRLPIDRVFAVKGFGTVITGTLGSGAIRVGDELQILPDGRAARVRGLQVHGQPRDEVVAPSRAAVNLGAIEASELARGKTLATAGAFAVTRRIDVRLALVDGVPSLKHGARVRVHHGTDELFGRVALASIREAGDGWTPVLHGEGRAAVPPAGAAHARVRLDRPGVFTRGDRIVIRAFSPVRTIGGGLVVDPEPPGGGLRRPEMRERFVRLDPEDGTSSGDFAAVWLGESALQGLDAATLVRRGGLDAAQARTRLETLADAGAAVKMVDRYVDASRVAEVERRVQSELEAFHRAHPLETGIPRDQLRDLVAAGAFPALFDAVIVALAARGVVTGKERLALGSHRPGGDAGTIRRREVVERLVADGGLTPPDAASLQQASQLSAAVLDQIMRLLIGERRLVRIGSLVFHADALARLRADVQTLKAAAAGRAAEVDVATFKSRYGLSRKYAIPLLEWLDQARVTRRVGEKRVIL